MRPSAANRAGIDVEQISLTEVRRLALARAGLLKPEWVGLNSRAAGAGQRARRAAHELVRHFGYLQLDTVSIAGARSHALVLLSRLAGFDPRLAEELLRPGEPLFEYWGHEACWLPLELYPAFAFRRRAFREHPWWGDVVGAHPEVAQRLLAKIRDEGALRSIDMEGRGSRGWWDLKLAKRVATALWCSGELAIRERTNFQRSYDLAERVIPEELRRSELPRARAFELLLEKGLEGHGWATTGTLAQTWRIRKARAELEGALARLQEAGRVLACRLVDEQGGRKLGWIRAADLELADRLRRVRPRCDQGVLLSPFDPVLWDRARVGQLFGFEQRLEIFKPAAQRVWGYFCLPVLAGERLVARYDLKADRARGVLCVLACHYEAAGGSRARPASKADAQAARVALQRHADSLELRVSRA